MSMRASNEPSPQAKSSDARLAWRHAVTGSILAILAWVAAHELRLNAGVPYLGNSDYDYLIIGLLGAAVGLTRLRGLLWLVNGALCAAILIIGYTPLIVAPMHALVQSDPPHPCEAVVVLSSDLFA